MSQFDSIQLGEIATFSYGKMPKKEKLGIGIYPTFSGYKYQYTYPEYNCEMGDIIVVARGVGGTGDVKIVKEKSYLTNLSIKINFDAERVDNFYFYYFCLANTLRHLDSGSAQSQITIADLSRFNIVLPPLEQQKAIVSVLKNFDDKIALNREMNKTLEAMAQAIFKSWFIDFEPFRDGEFVESELGMIPQGWEVKPLTECTKVVGGGTPKTSIPEYWNGDIPWFSVVDTPSGSDVFVVETEKSITQEGLNNSSTKLLDAGTTIVTARGTVGKIALVGTAMTMNQSCYALAPIDDTPYFTYYLVSSSVAELKQKTHGSVFDTITRETLSSIQVIMPNVDILKEFESKVESIMLRIKENLLEIKTLSTLRDTLLPKLLSGEIEV